MRSDSTKSLIPATIGQVALAVTLLAVCALLSGCGTRGHAPAPGNKAKPAETAAVAVTVGIVESRPVQRMVASVGTLQGFEEITLTPEVEGRVLRIHHDVGDRIKPGETIVEIDPIDFELAAEEARRALELELAKLGLAAPPDGNFEIRELPTLKKAEALLDRATQDFERIKTLRERRVSTDQEFEQVRANQRVAESDLRQAVLEAKTTLAAVKHREAAVAKAEKRLADTIIVAPAFPSLQGLSDRQPDYVVAQRLVSEGEMVRAFPSTAVMQLVIDNPLKLTTAISERYLGEVQVDQPVKLKVDAYGDEIFEGKVTRVSPTVDPASHTFVVEALVDNSEHRLKAGGFAKMGIFTRVDNNARTVPLEALVTFAGVNKVFVVRDGKATGVEVRPGVRGAGWVEVVGALEVGDRVVTSGQSKLADGTPVRVRDEQPAVMATRTPG